MNRRALIIAAALALAGVTLLFMYMKRYEREMSGGDQVELLAAVKPIKRGTIITDEMLTTRDVPIAYVEGRAIKAAERSKVIGLQTASAIEPQETVMWTDLAITTEDRDVSSLVQPGKRAVTLRAAQGDDSALNGLVRPGDYVDVVATMDESTKPNAAATDPNAKERVAVVLLQKVLVLAVMGETQAGPSSGENKPTHQNLIDKTITLSLNVKEAQLLALAMEKGKVSVAVRNPDDPRVSDLPDMPASALADTSARAAAQSTGHGRRTAEQPVKITEERR